MTLFTPNTQAAEALGNFPNPLTKTALLETILNKNFYFRVRLKACDTLVQVLNSMAGSGVSAGPIISLYQRVYGSKCAPNILKYLDFSDVAAYELQKVIWSGWCLGWVWLVHRVGVACA